MTPEGIKLQKNTFLLSTFVSFKNMFVLAAATQTGNTVGETATETSRVKHL